MIRIICPECKNAYLQKAETELTCPGCSAKFPESEENFLSGAQYYNEGDFASAGDCLMKYIVKNGAEPRAIFYKALCDAQGFDEDTITLKDLYVKILESLLEISDDDFPRYLALANDEALKIEKAVTQLHVGLFADADAEKIKKEVSAIIRLQDEAKIYRNKLNEFANSYNERANNKISVKLSDCFFVDPAAAEEVGTIKCGKIIDSINAHTVFTGILSNDIKNLEIYYRCIVMFFEKNRRKYEFLMSSSEKFAQIAKLLEDGRYASIKGVPTICEKLKSAAYDFFQESLHDHDDEFEQQTETVVVIEAQTVEIPVEEPEAPVEAEEAETETTEFEDVYSSTMDETTEEAEETTEIVDVYSSAVEAEAVEVTENEEAPVDNVEYDTQPLEAEDYETEPLEEPEAEEIAVVEIEEVIKDAAETETDSETAETEAVAEIEEATEPEESSEATENPETTQAEENTVVEIEETAKAEEVAEITEPVAENDGSPVTLLKTIAENGNLIENDEPEVSETDEKTEDTQPRKHKKSIAPFVVVGVVVILVIGLIAVAVLPTIFNKSNYKKAGDLFTEGKYAEASVLYEKLGDYEDSEDKYLESRYAMANALLEEGKFNEAKEIYISLGNYEQSAGKIKTCEYGVAEKLLNDGKFDIAVKAFKNLGDYSDSADRINECNFKKAEGLIEAEKYEDAIAILETIPDYTGAEDKILEAKYAYVNKNLDAENETTLSYLKDLTQAKYLDSADIRNKLLGTSTVLGEGISTCINYSATDTNENLEKVEAGKTFYYHVTVTDEALYTKKLTLVYETSAGYGFPDKSFVLTENENIYTLTYTADPGANYSITFSVLDTNGATLISQTVAIK